MKTISQHIRDHALQAVGFNPARRLPGLGILRLTEWSPKFETLMRNRLIMGGIRYGRLGSSGKSQYDRCEYIDRKVQEYQSTGNLECLVDIANLALCEFVEGVHPLKHFASVGDHTNHAKEIS